MIEIKRDDKKTYKLFYKKEGYTTCYASIKTNGNLEQYKQDVFLDISIKMPCMEINKDCDEIFFHVDHPEEIQNIVNIAEAIARILAPIVDMEPDKDL